MAAARCVVGELALVHALVPELLSVIPKPWVRLTVRGTGVALGPFYRRKGGGAGRLSGRASVWESGRPCPGASFLTWHMGVGTVWVVATARLVPG